MNNIPVPRDQLRKLKHESEDEKRREKVKRVINDIYEKVLDHAKTTFNSTFKYGVYQATIVRGNPNKDDIFRVKNIDDIIQGLKILFPDCSVQQRMYINGYTRMYDTTELDSVHPSCLISDEIPMPFIVID